jgi:hypothetical protein
MQLPMSLDLTKMVGPLPLGGWLAVVGVGVGVSVLNGRKNAAAPASAAAPLVPPIPSATLDPLGPSPSDFGTSAPVTAQPGGATSNTAWVQLAQATMRTMRRPWSGYDIGQALGKYLNGSTLSDTERQIVDDALSLVGYPPDGTTVAPDPVPTIAAGSAGSLGYEREPANLRPNNLNDPTLGDAQLGAKRTRVQAIAGPPTRGETPAEIAARVYGTPSQANFIHWFNTGVWVSDNTPIPVGTLIAY